MTTGSANLMTESAESSVFGIPLNHRSRFENWGHSSDESVSPSVSGLHEFIGDDKNRWLRCFCEANRFNSILEPHAGFDTEEFLPNRSVSPIVFYGESGTGKTSLAMSLIAKIAKQINPDSDSTVDAMDQLLCLSGNEFYRRYVAAMDRQTINDFRQHFLSCSGLVIDNVEQLEGKLASQRELVFLIDQLNRSAKPIVVTMQQSPLETNCLIPQLLSRLGGGIGFPVFPPGLLARREIIQRLSILHRTPLTQEAAEWVAQRMTVSVPKLNHFFIQLKTELRSRRTEPTANENKPVDMITLGLIFQRDNESIDRMTAVIIDTVANEFEMPTSMLCSNSRKQTVVMARGVAIWLLRTMLGISYHCIGTRFGNRDHTTILHAFQKYDALISNKDDDSDSNLTIRTRVRVLNQRLNETFAGEMTLIS